MKKVLIAEDNSTLRKLLEIGLRPYTKHFTTVFAWNGEEAIHVLEREKIDLLVTDLRMPKVDGFQLLAHLNRHHPMLPCIVMTAPGAHEVRSLVNGDGIQYIEKPFDPEKLAAMVKKGLARRKFDTREKPTDDCIYGISITNFLQLLQLEEKSHLMEVEVPGEGMGYIYLQQGVLYDAVFQGKNGTQAALNLIKKDRVQVCFKDLPKKKIRRRIQENLTSLILKSGETD